MTRGGAEFADYVRSLSYRKSTGETLTESENDWYVQGCIAGACQPVEDKDDVSKSADNK